MKTIFLLTLISGILGSVNCIGAPTVTQHKLTRIELSRELGGASPELSLDALVGKKLAGKTIRYIQIEAIAETPSKRGVPAAQLGVEVIAGKKKIGSLFFELKSVRRAPGLKRLAVNLPVDEKSTPIVLRNRGIPILLHSIELIH